MKIRLWPALIALVSIVALAAEEAPPAELLQNLDFYQNMNMVQDPQFLDMATQKQASAPSAANTESPAVDSTTIHLTRENVNAAK